MKLPAPASLLNKSIKAANERDRITDRLIETAKQSLKRETEIKNACLDPSKLDDSTVSSVLEKVNEGNLYGTLNGLIKTFIDSLRVKPSTTLLSLLHVGKTSRLIYTHVIVVLGWYNGLRREAVAKSQIS